MAVAAEAVFALRSNQCSCCNPGMLECLTFWLDKLFPFRIRHHEQQLPGKGFRLVDLPGFGQLRQVLQNDLLLGLLQFCIRHLAESLEYMVELLDGRFSGAFQLVDQLMGMVHHSNL